jgi:uncharacterized membrane protein YhaH (DUF805 family)
MGGSLLGFGGRLPRLRYFLLGLVTLALFAAAMGVIVLATRVPGVSVRTAAIAGAVVVLVVASVVGAGLTVRRLHDLDLSGWWILAIWLGPAALQQAILRLAGDPKPGNALAAAVELAIGLALWLLPGTPGANRFGPDPRAAERRP